MQKKRKNTALLIGTLRGTIKSTKPESFTRGAELAGAGYADEASIVAAFKGAEVMISTIGSRAGDQQEVLGKAAKAAGVKLVPYDFGVPTEVAINDPSFVKEKFAEFLKGINLPYFRVITGIWSDFCLVP